MATDKLPEYLRETDAGIEITFNNPAEIAGAKVSKLVMREPTVRDMEIAQSGAGSDAAKEVQLLANLLGLGADDVRGLTLRNHKRVQEAFANFTD